IYVDNRARELQIACRAITKFIYHPVQIIIDPCNFGPCPREYGLGCFALRDQISGTARPLELPSPNPTQGLSNSKIFEYLAIIGAVGVQAKAVAQRRPPEGLKKINQLHKAGPAESVVQPAC